jgi:DNA-binding transcriptional regulator YiaG
MLPHQIKKLRIAMKMTQGEFAARLGLKTKGAIAHWESGRKDPPGTALVLLNLLAAEFLKKRAS